MSTSEVGTPAIFWAAVHGHRKVVEVLLKKGANVNVKGLGGITALIGAAQNGHREVVELLLKKGANVNADMEGGITALSWGLPCMGTTRWLRRY